MITPSYGLTATERVLPSFVLDWTTGEVQSSVDVVRAGSATYIDSDGLLKTASADTQRIDWSTGVAGLLVEESRQNELLYSNTFDNGAWTTLVGGTGSTPIVTPNAGISPDGTNNAYRLQANRGAGNTVFDQSVLRNILAIVYANPHNMSVSIWAKSNTGLNQRVYFRNITGAGGSIITVTPEWQRFSFSGSAASNVEALQIGTRGGADIDADIDILIFNGQLEIAAFPTSDIINEGTRVTRNADVATVTGTNFSDWFNPTEGTFVFEGSLYAFEIGKAHLTVRSDPSNFMRIRTAPSGSTEVRFEATDGGVSQVALTPSIINVSDFAEVFAYKENDFAVAVGRGTVLTDTSATVPTINEMFIGQTVGGVTQYNGLVRKILYYPQRLTNAEVQAFSR